jgi:hypothetical protein
MVPRVREHDLDHAREVLVELRDEGFGIAALGHRREPAHVREQHAHRPAPAAKLGQLRVGEHLIEDVLRHVAREELRDLPLVAALDEILPRQAPDRGDRSTEEAGHERHPRAGAEGLDGRGADAGEREDRRALPASAGAR